MAGPSSDLIALRCTRAWDFHQDGTTAVLQAADRAGRVVWRLTGDYPYDRMTFAWHPTVFEPLYARNPSGYYGEIAFVALIFRLLSANGLVLHGSAQMVDGAAILCAGLSGCGKSTISRLFASCGLPVLTDEHPVLRADERAQPSGFRVYGSPWPSSGKFVLNASAPLRKIYFLEHGTENEQVPLKPRTAIFRLLSGALVPWMDAAFFDPMIATLEALLRRVPCAVLRFRPDASAVDFVRRDLATF
jgi:hypothetical protein